MKKRRSVFCAIVTVMMLVFVVEANAGVLGMFGKKKEKKQEKVEGNKEKTLTVWIMPNSAESKADLEALTEEFTQKTGVKVEVTVLDWGIAWNKITTAATSGIGPDIIQIGTTWVPTIAAMGVFEDLKPYLPKDVEDKFLPAAWAYSSMKGSDEISTVPWFSDVRPFYYRKDIFAKAGLNPDEVFEDWDSFKAAVRKINGMEIDGVKVAGFGHPGKNDWNVPFFIAAFVWAGGGDFLSEDGKKAILTEEAAVKAIEFYGSFVQEGLVPKHYLEKNTAEVEALFRAGDCAIFSTGPWLTRAIDKQLNGEGSKNDEGEDTEVLDRIGVALPPKGPGGRYTFFGGSMLGMFNFSENKKEAAELIKYLTLKKETVIEYSKVSGQFPSLIEAKEDPYIANSEYRTKIAEAAQYGRAFPTVPWWGPIETILVKNLGSAWDCLGGINGEYSEEKLISILENANREMEVMIRQSE